MIRITASILLLFFTLSLLGQDSNKPAFRFQGDSRKTFVDRKSADIYGIRGGLLFKNKYELGIGIYSSNLFGILGNDVSKDYQDNNSDPVITIPSEIGFHYLSVYGEYTVLENARWKLTANSQIGIGRVDINFVETTLGKDRIREAKSLVEHSFKADVLTFRWLRLMGGLGYRYLINGEDQIKKAFNAPIYIIGFSIDFKKLFNKEKS